ncbi:hypothetical protein U91I_03419 [alpha proteobacterium U9-1i]|nr:hypothetical protein U91I_03419 [alpha proteobacterium U9-1i]
MIESDAASESAESDWAEPLTPFDAANYIHEMSREMAAMAGGASLPRVAAALELARDLAAEAMAQTSRKRP